MEKCEMNGMEYCIIADGKLEENIIHDLNLARARLESIRSIRKLNGSNPMDVKLCCRMVSDWCECTEASR